MGRTTIILIVIAVILIAAISYFIYKNNKNKSLQAVQVPQTSGKINLGDLSLMAGTAITAFNAGKDSTAQTTKTV